MRLGENRSTPLSWQRSWLGEHPWCRMHVRRHRTAPPRGFRSRIPRVRSWTFQGVFGGFAASAHRRHHIQILRRRLLSSRASGRHPSSCPRRTQKQIPHWRTYYAIFAGLMLQIGGTLHRRLVRISSCLQFNKKLRFNKKWRCIWSLYFSWSVKVCMKTLFSGMNKINWKIMYDRCLYVDFTIIMTLI